MPSAKVSVILVRTAVVAELVAFVLLIVAATGAAPLLPYSNYDDASGGVLDVGLLKAKQSNIFKAGDASFWFSDERCKDVISVRGGFVCEQCTNAGAATFTLIMLATGIAMCCVFVSAVRLRGSNYGFVNVALSLGAAVGVAIAWIIWQSGCHFHLQEVLDELELDGDDFGLSWGFAFAVAATPLLIASGVLHLVAGPFTESDADDDDAAPATEMTARNEAAHSTENIAAGDKEPFESDEDEEAVANADDA